MFTLKELEDWLEELWRICLDINIISNNMKRYAENVYLNEKKVMERGFFIHYYFQLQFILAIQICKVLDPRSTQETSVPSLIKKFKNSTLEDQLLQKIKSNQYVQIDQLKKIRELFIDIEKKLENNSELIGKIVTVRDKNYAHNDPDKSTFGPSKKEYFEAVDLATKICDDISFQFFGIRTFFDETTDWSIDPIIKDSANQYNLLLESIKNKRLGHGPATNST